MWNHSSLMKTQRASSRPETSYPCLRVDTTGPRMNTSLSKVNITVPRETEDKLKRLWCISLSVARL